MSLQFGPKKDQWKASLRVISRRFAVASHSRTKMVFPTYNAEVAGRIDQYPDEFRYSMLALALQRLELDHVAGSFAEVGVYRGTTSSFIHQQSPQRRFFLFDTFEGFPIQDLDGRPDDRFNDSSEEAVRTLIGDNENLVFRKGYFPATASGLEHERFAFVMLDCDLYLPSLAVFEFFYPRMTRGAYLFMHDFNSPESGSAVSRAATGFMADKPEMLIEMPDQFGSALFRKL